MSTILQRQVSTEALRGISARFNKDGKFPLRVLEIFLACMETPRPSDACDAIRAKLRGLAEANKLDVKVDAAGNMRIRKPATPGCEDRLKIVIQAHLDMVTSKTTDKVHDFHKDPIDPVLTEDGWLKADRTTLGADDGIGMAAALALLESNDINHGPIEALFTAEEETTMDGAAKVDPTLLEAEALINVDSEEEHSVCMGCAGGFEKLIRLPVTRDAGVSSEQFTCLRLSLIGLLGGHTGVDINKGRGNALQLMARMLNHVAIALESKCGSGSQAPTLRLATFAGGNAPNAIPRDATADIVVPTTAAKEIETMIMQYFEGLREEFAFETEKKTEKADSKAEAKSKDPVHATLKLEITPQSSIPAPCNAATTRRILDLMLCAPHGVLRLNRWNPEEVDASISFSKAGLLAAESKSADAGAKGGESKEAAAASAKVHDCCAAAAAAAAADPSSYSPSHFLVHIMCRSNRDDFMDETERKLESLARMAGATFSDRINYFPGWVPDMKTSVLEAVRATHKELFAGKEAKVYSVHAGLECGYIVKQYPRLQCVSIGPEIRDAHSPDEQLNIASVGPFFAWLKASVAALAKVKSPSAS